MPTADGDTENSKFDEELLRAASRAVAKEIGNDASGKSGSTYVTVTRAQYETAAKRLSAKVDAKMTQLLKDEV